MNIYLRKVFQHDVTHQISITKSVLIDFFDNPKNEEFIFVKGKKSNHKEQVSFLLATDPRLGGGIRNLIKAEKEQMDLEVNDILLFEKRSDRYILEVISSYDERFNTFNKLLENNRHLIIHTDDFEQDNNQYELIKEIDSTEYFDNFVRNRIIFGAPGTGKSYMLNQEKGKLLSKGGEFERVTFHPDYSYASFVGAYKPVPALNSRGESIITYEYVPGPFVRMYIKAIKNIRSEDIKPHLLIIEEINRSNAAAVFGDIFQLLDRENNESEFPISPSKELSEYLAKEDVLGGNPSDYYKIALPSNFYIWATMNSADQGVYPMDTAFKRRWDFTYLGIDDGESVIANRYIELGSGSYKRLVEWNRLRKAINAELTNNNINEDKLLGPFFIMGDFLFNHSNIDATQFNSIFKNKIIMYLFEDAAKHKRELIFSGCDNSDRKLLYSDVCKEFDDKGIYVFSNNLTSKFEKEQHQDQPMLNEVTGDDDI